MQIGIGIAQLVEAPQWPPLADAVKQALHAARDVVVIFLDRDMNAGKGPFDLFRQPPVRGKAQNGSRQHMLVTALLQDADIFLDKVAQGEQRRMRGAGPAGRPGRAGARGRRQIPHRALLGTCRLSSDALDAGTRRHRIVNPITIELEGTVRHALVAITVFNQEIGLRSHNVRDDAAQGRHTPTARSMYRMHAGGWLVDTPGMRELALHDASDGIDMLFADITEMATGCKFSDCQHETEPGCLIRAAIDAGDLDPDRLERWRKLKDEDLRNSESVAEARARGRKFSKMVKSTMKVKRARRGQ